MEKTGYLSTHVLDTVRGLPAAGVAISLYSLNGDERRLVTETATNDDGRTDSPLIAKGHMEQGVYEIVFHMGEYFERHGLADGSPFLDSVPVRFRIDNENLHYHVPLLASPFSYSTYRGS